ncbi:hypothetical protein PFISCL1PPCAC_22454, partial [Pristionchus fissidentatus]
AQYNDARQSQILSFDELLLGRNLTEHGRYQSGDDDSRGSRLLSVVVLGDAREARLVLERRVVDEQTTVDQNQVSSSGVVIQLSNIHAVTLPRHFRRRVADSTTRNRSLSFDSDTRDLRRGHNRGNALNLDLDHFNISARHVLGDARVRSGVRILRALNVQSVALD